MEQKIKLLNDFETDPSRHPFGEIEHEASDASPIETSELIERIEKRRPPSAFSFELKALGAWKSDSSNGSPPFPSVPAFPSKPSPHSTRLHETRDHLSR